MTSNLIASLTAIICISMSVFSGLGSGLKSQATQTPSERTNVIGEVTSIDLNSRAAAIKTDSGQTITLSFANSARILKAPAGATSLTSASETTLAGISVGDRISSRGLPSADKSRLSAETVIVMSRADIQKKQDQENREWATRSIAGLVRELQSETAE